MTDQLREAMRAARRSSDMSFASFARRAGFTEGHLRSVENGRRGITGEIACAYDRVLGTGGTFETALHTAAEAARISDVDRRELLRLGGLVAIMAAGPATTSGIEARLEDSDVNPRLWAEFNDARYKAALLPQVLQHLTTLAEVLDRRLAPRARRRSLVAAADLLQLSGEIMYDGRRYDDAAACYTSAVAAAREAGEPDLWACALTRHAYVSLAGRRNRDAAQVLQPAVVLADRGDGGLSTRFWVASVQAKAYAGLGNAEECLRALDTADRVAGMGLGSSNGGWLRFDGSRLAEERGACLVALNKPAAAEPVLLDALGHLASGRRKGAVLADLVAVGAQMRDPERIADYGAQALRIATATGSGYVVQRLAAVQPELQGLLGAPSVAEVDRQIRALAARPTSGAAA
jgi:tetratricopeptide (TPR) repeat protein